MRGTHHAGRDGADDHAAALDQIPHEELVSELDSMPNDQFQMTKRTRRTERAVEIPPPGLRPHWSCGFGHS